MAAAATSAAPLAAVDGASIRRAITETHARAFSYNTGLAQGPPGATGGAHVWSLLDAESFQIRGPNYLVDKVKVDASPAVFELMQVDVFVSHDKIGNVALRRDSWLRTARAAGDTRYYLVIVYVTPQPPHIHLIFYLAVQQERLDANPRLRKLWTQFIAHGAAADEFRNERWKVIPRIAEGAWVVQKAVGTKPALLAQKLTHTWVICDEVSDALPGSTAGAAASASGDAASGGRGEAAAKTVESTDTGCATGVDFSARARGGSFVTSRGPGPYLEADCDVSSSSMAYWLTSLLQQYAKHVVIDLAFTIEPREKDTLPEEILAAVRLHHIEVGKMPVIAANPEDWLLGSMGTTHAEARAAEEEYDE